MARPIKNNADYFSHDAGMRNHKKVKAIRSKFGITGYAVWSMLLEYLTGGDGNVFPYTDLEFELMSGDFGIPATEIRSVVDYCVSIELLFNKNGFINSDSLDERLAPVYEKRRVAKELSKQQQRTNGQFSSNNTEQHGETVTEIPQSKVKESKGNETKVEEIKAVDNIPEIAATKVATIEDRQKTFFERLNQYASQYDAMMLKNFFEYWCEKNPNGRKMRFEMQKVFDMGRRLSTWNSNNKLKIIKTNGTYRGTPSTSTIEPGKDFGKFG